MTPYISLVVEIVISLIIITQVIFPIVFNYQPFWIFKKDQYSNEDSSVGFFKKKKRGENIKPEF